MKRLDVAVTCWMLSFLLAYLQHDQGLLLHSAWQLVVLLIVALLLLFVATHRAELGGAMRALVVVLLGQAIVEEESESISIDAIHGAKLPRVPVPRSLFERPPPCFL